MSEEEYIDDLDYIAGIVKQNKKLINENVQLQQENKQLKEELDLQFKDLIKRIQENNDEYLEEKNKLIKENHHLKSILTELEEWLKEQLMYFCENNEQGGFSTNVEDLEMVLDKIQELKEKYK